ncbi:MAG: hypothetical protein H6512_14070 [Acidimicrobiia bacterium]|nr:hypothetical protein [Acidimicrobiia bacterium]
MVGAPPLIGTGRAQVTAGNHAVPQSSPSTNSGLQTPLGTTSPATQTWWRARIYRVSLAIAQGIVYLLLVIFSPFILTVWLLKRIFRQLKLILWQMPKAVGGKVASFARSLAARVRARRLKRASAVASGPPPSAWLGTRHFAGIAVALALIGLGVGLAITAATS